jgi:hypothetical protein
MIMSMGWDYVCELRPPTGLLFVPQIHENVQPWWNDDREKHLIHAPELSGNPTSSHLVAKQEELVKEMNLAF